MRVDIVQAWKRRIPFFVAMGGTLRIGSWLSPRRVLGKAATLAISTLIVVMLSDPTMERLSCKALKDRSMTEPWVIQWSVGTVRGGNHDRTLTKTFGIISSCLDFNKTPPPCSILCSHTMSVSSPKSRYQHHIPKPALPSLSILSPPCSAHMPTCQPLSILQQHKPQKQNPSSKIVLYRK